MKPTVNWQAFKIGMRTFKTAVAVGTTLTLFELLNRQPAYLAALSAVFTLRTEHDSSWTYGKIRIFGNTLGVIIAMCVVQLGVWLMLPASILRIFGSVVGIILVIVLCNAFIGSASIINCSATFFVVLLNTPTNNILNYGSNRILDTIIGALIAIIINQLLPSPKRKTNETV